MPVFKLFTRYRVTRWYWKYWKIRNCEINFQDLEKVFEFGQNVQKVFKKYENSKFSYVFIQLLFFATDSFANVSKRLAEYLKKW